MVLGCIPGQLSSLKIISVRSCPRVSRSTRSVPCPTPVLLKEPYRVT